MNTKTSSTNLGSNPHRSDDYLQGTKSSAADILPLLFSKFDLTSVVDIGCGYGEWLSVARSTKENLEILGVDGPWICENQLEIPPDKMIQCDFTNSVERSSLMTSLNGRHFDLALCLEVAEHLPASSAHQLVELLCSLSDLVLFSAAIPYQGGWNHVNEQWPTYWAEIFSRRGFLCADILRSEIWNNESILPHYRQNCLVFFKEGGGLPAIENPLSLVHPFNWNLKQQLIDELQQEQQRQLKVSSQLKRLVKSIFSMP
ncbi:MAG: class I SAM-dependent methyltransferase [Verrucomicrobiae bacterium]|nr:class I SAM-dependent methyltransferase [Verrucomicrobiae bacterium]NNJ44023.1 methyltransferase domain-containing protein [Akkermansiaceae bacterium]